MKIQCPYCRAVMEIQPEHLGRKADCPACNFEMQIPVLTAKIIDPPQPEPVSVKMIARGVVRGLFFFWSIVFAAAVVISIIIGIIAYNEQRNKVKEAIETMKRAEAASRNEEKIQRNLKFSD